MFPWLNRSGSDQAWMWPVNMNWAFQKIWLITSDPRFNNGGGQLLFHRDQLGLDSFLRMHSSLCIFSGIFPLMLKVISWSEPCKCLLRLCCGFAVQFPVCVAQISIGARKDCTSAVMAINYMDYLFLNSSCKEISYDLWLSSFVKVTCFVFLFLCFSTEFRNKQQWPSLFEWNECQSTIIPKHRWNVSCKTQGDRSVFLGKMSLPLK